MKYAIWNNKGGVGKSFLCFTLATEYAKKHPQKKVVVIDMCPQANVSEIILGGNGGGAEKIQSLIEAQISDGFSRTIGGYFDARIRSPHQQTGSELSYAIKPSESNEKIPQNISLIAGDPSLELQIQTVNAIATQTLPDGAWANVHSWIKDLQKAIENHCSGRKLVFFIDCNPSFSSYTEQAILAADRLIVPCTPDGSSARAIGNLARLVYGYRAPQRYTEGSFHSKARQANMAIPKIHLVLLNKASAFSSQPAKAFQAMLNQVKKRFKGFCEDPTTQSVGVIEKGRNIDDIFRDMPDAHTVAVASSSSGLPLYELQPGSHKLPDGTKTMINKDPLNRYKQAISGIVNNL